MYIQIVHIENKFALCFYYNIPLHVDMQYSFSECSA